MKWMLVCAASTPENGEWEETCEFITGSMEEIKRAFDAAVVDGEYPFIIMGPVKQEAHARYEVDEYEDA